MVVENSAIKKKPARESGIELLRILAACAVVMLHYNDGKAFELVNPGSINHYLLYLLESISICAVDVFLLISGYFLCSTNKRTLGKPMTLFVQVILVHFFYYIITLLTGHAHFSIPALIESLIPANYFVILYAVVYFVSPYINILLHNLTRWQFTFFVSLLLIVFSLYATFTDVVNELRGSVWFGLSPVTAWGNQQGFTIVNFILLYIVGAYLRLSGIPTFIKAHTKLLSLMTVALIFGWAIVCDILPKVGLRSAWVYCNPFVILLSVSLFTLFSAYHFHSSIINVLAKSSFTCFLVHQYVIGFFNISDYVNAPIYCLLLHVIVTIISIYLICWFIWKVYDMVIQPLVSKMDKYTIVNIE